MGRTREVTWYIPKHLWEQLMKLHEEYKESGDLAMQDRQTFINEVIDRGLFAMNYKLMRRKSPSIIVPGDAKA